MRTRSSEALSATSVALLLLALGACSTSPAGTESRDAGGGDAGARWYDTALDRDTSYLPMGRFAVNLAPFAWTSPSGGALTADAYVPAGAMAPVVLVLPGAAIVKERMYWLGELLASQGFATLVVQPPGTFSTSELTTSLLDALAASPLAPTLDLTRVILAGHSQGAVVQAALTDVASCAAGFCSPGAKRPDGVRGLLLMGYHNQTNPDDAAPMPAADIPWLVLSGSADGVSTPDKVQKTFARIVDRPLFNIEVQGMNHYQFTDYVDPKADRVDGDGVPAIANKVARATAGSYAVAFAKKVLNGDASIADDLGAGSDARVRLASKSARATVTDVAGMPRVLRDEFGPEGLRGASGNCDVVASQEYNGALYLLTRNETAGSEVWRILKGGSLEQVPFANGVKNGIYGNKQVNGLLGGMAVFQNKLWIGFSSGVQGSARGSTGAEVWTFDGATWAPIIANRDDDPRVTLTKIDGCDGAATTAVLTASAAAWKVDEWKGARIDDIDAMTGAAVVLEVLSNTATTLTVLLNERGGSYGRELLDCKAIPVGDAVRSLKVGDVMRLRRGKEHAGFGQSWNKLVTAMEVFGGKLYVSTGLNYQYGSEIYVTADGKTFDVAVSRQSLAVAGEAQPTTSSITAMHVSDALGVSTLYFSGTGTGGYGARLFALSAAGSVTPLIDNVVGAAATGLTSAGLGLGIAQLPSMATFDGRLWLGAFGGNGLQIFSVSKFGAAPDLRVDVGEAQPLGPGFGDTNQVIAHLDVAQGQLWSGALIGTTSASDLRETSSHVWRRGAAASAAKGAWQRVTAHAFGLNAISSSRVVAFDGALYAVSGSAALTSHTCLAPVRLYTLRDEARP